MEIPKYLVIKLEQTDKETVTATDITGRCEVIEHDADRKTESNSEKPNNCEDLQDWKDRMWAEAVVTEPTISKMEQVDKDINVRSKDEPKTKKPSCCAECKVWYRCFEEKPPYNMIKSRCPINEDEQSGKECADGD